MYAVIKTGGKQHKVQPGDVIEVELMHSSGDTVTFTPLLVVDDDGGAHVGKEASKAKVTAKLVGEQKGDKVKIFKYRPKTGYAKRAGHRQMYTLIEIQEVSLGGASKRASTGGAKKDEEAKPKAERPAKAERAVKTEKPAKADKADKAETAERAEAAATTDEPADQPEAQDIGAVTESEVDSSPEVSAETEDEAANAGGPEA